MVDKERAKQVQIKKVHDIVDLMEKNSVIYVLIEQNAKVTAKYRKS